MNKVAVVGGGVAGLVSAHELAKSGWDVTLFEKERRVGGHTHTVEVEDGPDAGTPVDTGFIVCNDRTYPGFHRFLAELGVPWRWADMSFGCWDEASGLQYAGTTLSGVFAQRRNLLSPAFWRLLAGIGRFGRGAAAELGGEAMGRETLRAFLARHAVPDAVRDLYIVPMGAAIWSASAAEMLDFPALTYARFFHNHGLLTFTDRPAWQTVKGGSHSYVKAFLARFPGKVRRGEGVKSLRRLEAGGVELTTGEGWERFDRAVVACHADEALALLSDPSPDEKRLLGAWKYSKNDTWLHTDTSLLPPNPRAWASWNYRRFAAEDSQLPVSVTYDMNRLQGLRTRKTYLVTLNPRRLPAPEHVLRRIDYRHPTFDFPALRSQAELPSLNGVRSTWFCGSYFGYGFHEDAVQSGLRVAAGFARRPQEVRL
jgi:predicted NAD/FAD-binding protein